MKYCLGLFFFYLLFFNTKFINAQGDDCTNAVQLTNLSNYCTSGGTYSNETATASSYSVSSCWNSSSTIDVWFKFIAVGTEVLITVNGSGNSTGATLQNPEITLTSSACGGSISEMKCNTTKNTSKNYVSVYYGTLDPGTTYYFRIATSATNKGKFDLCINNYTTVPNPNDPNDCKNATIICNKDAVSVGTFNGYGSDNKYNNPEVNLGCFSVSEESNSNWLTFKCKTSGTLEFDINGAKVDDDIDWMLMEIPAMRNCSSKTVLSCNIASCDINGDASQSSGNPRFTGIRSGESAANLVDGTNVTKDSEPGGCTSTSNGYNNTLNIVAGKSYVLFVNNDVASSGYSVKWGGTSTFVGPESKITVDKTTICAGDNISVNGSTSLDYATFKWDLPADASPSTQTSIGPFNQTFNKPGTYPIILTTYDAGGCISVKNTLVTVNGINADFTSPSVCVGNPTVFTCTTAGLSSWSWDFGDGTSGTGTPTSHPYANPGDYTAKLTVTGGGCTNVFSQKVSVLGATITTTPDPAQTCPGNVLTLNATASVTGNVSGSKVFNQNTAVTIPSTDGYSVGVDDTWDGSVGSGTFSALTSDVGISTISVSGLNGANWKINSVTINIATTKPKYLVAYLETPCGNRIKLIARTTSLTGTTGFQTTVFTPTSTKTIGSTGNTATPFNSGPYAASESTKWNTNLLSCTNPNGNWKLIVGEYVFGSSGSPSITNWSIDLQSDTPNLIQSLVWSPTTNLSAVGYTGTSTASGTATAKTSTAELLTLTVVDKSGCTSTKKVDVKVSVPTAPTCTGITVCTGQSGTLTATGNSGATFKWYADNTTTTTIAGSGTSSTFTTPNLNSLTSYYVSQVSGGCESTRTKVDVNVTNSNGITLTSAANTDDQTVCINSAINNITYSTTGATGATITGLPTGVTGSWNANIVTITGTPTNNSASPYTYTITLNGGCGGGSKQGKITVNSLNTITLTSGTGTDNQTICVNKQLTNITYNTTGATGANITGLPTGVTGSWSANVVTISGTPTINTGSPFNYTISLTGGCGTVTKTGTITVNPIQTLGVTCGTTNSSSVQFTWTNIPNATYNYSYLINNTGTATTGTLPIGSTNFTKSGLNPGDKVTITITPVGGTCVDPETFTCTAINCGTPTVGVVNSITECSNTAINAINFTSPQGTVTFNWTNNNTAIGLAASGTGNIPAFTSSTITTQQNATISVTATLSGCTGPQMNFNIIINPINTSTLTTPIGTDNQKICIGNSIDNILYTTTGATGIGTVTGLPNGVTANWLSNVITLTGKPTTTGTFNYTIPLTGGCGNINATGTITVNADKTAGAASSSPTLCINTSLSPVITHSTTNSTGLGTTTNNYGLPTGVTASFGSNTITINGNPSVSGTFSYTIPLLGCGTASATGTINITPLNTITGPGSRTNCINTAITDITHTTTGATGIGTATGLPTGVSASWLNNQITITGTPTSSIGSPFSYNIPLNGGCGTVNATGTITVNPISTGVLSSATGTDAQNVCVNSALTAITYTTTGVTAIGSPTNLPNGVTAQFTGTITSGTIKITGSPSTDGVNNYIIPLIAGCGTPDVRGTITINPLPIAIPTANTPCEQDELILDAGFSGATSYSWIGPNGFTESIEKPKISTVTLKAKGKYTVTVTDIKNCSKSSDIQVNINPIDNIQFSDIQATCKNNAVFNLPSVNIPGGTWSSDDLTSVTNSTNGVFDPSKSSPDQYYKVVVTYSTKTITSPSRLCPNIFSKVVYVYPTPDTSFLVKENLICITDNLIAEVINPNPNITYTWDFNNGQTLVGDKVNYNYPKGGVFDLTLTAKQGICSNTSVRKQHINVVDLPENIEILQSDTKIDFYNPEIQFKTNSNAKYFYWDFGDGTTSTYKNPKHKFPEKPGQYVVELTASNMLGKCSVSKTSSIFIPEPVIYFIPNTFTPNGDELNNTFQPVFTYGYDPQNYSFYIYSRWGDLIFESHDPKIGWDGTYGENIVQNDTYVWKLEFKEKIEETKHVKTGHVSLLK